MICERCKGDFPGKKGRFCGTCPTTKTGTQVLAETLADVLTELLCENHHQLVGGVAFAHDAVDRINAARSGASGTPTTEAT